MPKKIPLTKGQEAFVDDDDYERLKDFKWYAQWDSCTNSFYAYRSVKVGPGKWYMQGMHRDVLGLEPYTKAVADHKEPSETLDNRKDNLRIATHAQNNQNSRKRQDNSSGFKGVSWNSGDKKWCARITSEKKRRFLGNFDTPEQAYYAYVKASEILHKEFARII